MLDCFSKTIGYKFRSKEILEEALTHPSCFNSAKKSYEKLEFLGDAVLSFVITTFLFQTFPEDTEGSLTKRRAALVNGKTLAEIGSKINILDHVQITKNKSHLNEKEAMRIRENSLEALVGALYLDGGMEACEQFVIRHWGDFLNQNVILDPKSLLQEWSQQKKLGSPKYRLLSQSGPPHALIFTVSVIVATLPEFKASASSKQIAEKEAARTMWQHIRTYDHK